MARRVQKPYRKKDGEHGTLFLYQIEYVDSADRDNRGRCKIWGYTAEDALDEFYSHPDDGWKHVGRPKRVRVRR